MPISVRRAVVLVVGTTQAKVQKGESQPVNSFVTFKCKTRERKKLVYRTKPRLPPTVAHLDIFSGRGRGSESKRRPVISESRYEVTAET